MIVQRGGVVQTSAVQMSVKFVLAKVNTCVSAMVRQLIALEGRVWCQPCGYRNVRLYPGSWMRCNRDDATEKKAKGASATELITEFKSSPRQHYNTLLISETNFLKNIDS